MKPAQPLKIDVEQLFREWFELRLDVIVLEKCLLKAGVITEDQLRRAREETKREAEKARKALEDSMRRGIDPTKKGLVE